MDLKMSHIRVAATVFLFTTASGELRANSTDQVFPVCDAVIDVTKPPYNAKGDGVSDDTNAIQHALNDMMGLHKILYFPRGVYLVSKTLEWTNKNSHGQNAYGFNVIQG